MSVTVAVFLIWQSKPPAAWLKPIASVRDKLVGNSSMVKGTELFKLVWQVACGFEMYGIYYMYMTAYYMILYVLQSIA